MALPADSSFYTAKGYEILADRELTESLEDYVEMIYRCCQTDNFTRVSILSLKLNVKPSSASKMVSKLGLLGFVNYEKYGMIIFTEKGRKAGKYLVWRHNVLERFFSLLNGAPDMREIELCEHCLNFQTVKNMNAATALLIEDHDFKEKLAKFLKTAAAMGPDPPDYML